MADVREEVELLADLHVQRGHTAADGRVEATCSGGQGSARAGLA